MELPIKKNLIYFIFWNPSSDMLLLNLRMMNKYIHIFDGQVIIKIAGVTELNLVVYKEFPWLRQAEFVVNDPVFGERDHFKESLKRLNFFTRSITFYCHAKGVSRVVNDPLKWWVQLLYKGNLDTMPNMDGKMFSGCFGKLRKGSKNVPVPWHYSGSFYWFDTQKVLARMGEIPSEINNRWFTENFPGWIAKQDEAEFRLYSSSDSKYNCYRDEFWVKNKHLIELI